MHTQFHYDDIVEISSLCQSGIAQVSSVSKYNIMTSAKERDRAEESYIVASWERGHSVVEPNEVRRVLPTFFDQYQLSILLETKLLFSLRGGCVTSSQVMKSLNKTSYEICYFLRTMKLVPSVQKVVFDKKLPLSCDLT